ncbi:hypothetical protein BASA60_008201 [Batrachochytrium salamandrivorans]|nr:hypothetical protein BASA60_008201 [Batrachochytrium salamandrivorans]
MRLVALTLCFVSAIDFPELALYLVDEALHSPAGCFGQQAQPGDVATTLFHRRFASLSLDQDVRVRRLTPFVRFLARISEIWSCEVSFARKAQYKYQSIMMSAILHRTFVNSLMGHIFTVNQMSSRGVRMQQTCTQHCKSGADSSHRLKECRLPNAIFKPNFNFAEPGIGGP